MLGMSALTKRNPDLAWKKLSDLSRARERLSLGIERLDTKELIADQVRSFIFSDTLIAFSKGSTQNDALALLLLTTEVFTLALHYCIPLRGGIAHGRFSFNLDQNLFSGPALVDAYDLGETSQWLGVIVDDKTAEIVKNTPIRSEKGKDAVIVWDVPVKDGSRVRRNVVNWVETHRHNYVGPMPLTGELFYSQDVDTNYQLGLTWTRQAGVRFILHPTNNWAVGLAFDYTSGMTYSDSWAESLAAYVSFQATEKLKLNGRADWAKGFNGSAAGGYHGAFGYTSAGDGENQLFSLTCTADYALWKNVISRLELRWDTAMTDDSPFGGQVAAPGGTPLVNGDKTATSLTANFIYQF